MDTDRYTYLYGFCESVDTEEDMDEIYQTIFSQLYLSEGGWWYVPLVDSDMDDSSYLWLHSITQISAKEQAGA